MIALPCELGKILLVAEAHRAGDVSAHSRQEAESGNIACITFQSTWPTFSNETLPPKPFRIAKHSVTTDVKTLLHQISL